MAAPRAVGSHRGPWGHEGRGVTRGPWGQVLFCNIRGVTTSAGSGLVLQYRNARLDPHPCPRRPTNRPRRVPPAAALGRWYAVSWAPTPANQKLGGEGPWGQRAARLCGAEEHRACAQREARSWSCPSPLSERRERSERSEFGDAGARPRTARQSARSAPDRHSEAPYAVPRAFAAPPATT